MDFAGSINRQGQKSLSASIATFSALLMRGKVLAAASMATFSATLSRMAEKVLTASATTFNATVVRGRLIAASMTTFAGSFNKQLFVAFTSSMNTFGVAFSMVRATVQSFAASMATFSASIVKMVQKFFSAS